MSSIERRILRLLKRAIELNNEPLFRRICSKYASYDFDHRSPDLLGDYSDEFVAEFASLLSRSLTVSPAGAENILLFLMSESFHFSAFQSGKLVSEIIKTWLALHDDMVRFRLSEALGYFSNSMTVEFLRKLGRSSSEIDRVLATHGLADCCKRCVDLSLKEKIKGDLEKLSHDFAPAVQAEAQRGLSRCSGSGAR